MNLIPDLLTFYLDQRFAPSVDTREVCGMLYLPWDIFLKVGKMFLPYGLQLQDDNAFIRGGRNGSATTGFSFFVSQPAFEVGWEPGPVSFVHGGVAGRRRTIPTCRSPARSTPCSPSFRWCATSSSGVSGSYAGGGPDTSLVGFFAGSNLGRFTALGEVDFRHDQRAQPDRRTVHEGVGTFMTYVEGNYLAFDWLNVKAAFDYADWDGTAAAPGQRRGEPLQLRPRAVPRSLHPDPHLLPRQQRHPDELQPQPGAVVRRDPRLLLKSAAPLLRSPET